MTPEALLQTLIATPSVSGNEAQVADALSAQLSSAGFSVNRRGHNLWFEIGQSDGPTLLLNSHIDTVPPAEGWTREPFAPTWEGDRLYGLGSNDAGASVVTMSCAAEALAAQANALGGRLVCAFTAEEETGGDGIATILDDLGPIDAALVGEPTGLNACTAQRGLFILRITARGVAGHVAHANNSVNAIHMAARDINRLAAMEFESHPLLGQSRAQVTQISGGKQRNQVPESCEYFVDMRTTPNLDHARLAAEIDAALESDVAIHSARYHPKATPENSAIRAAVVSAGAKDCIASTTTSDWAFLGDIPAVKIGPGDTHRSHTADEYIKRDELITAVAFYTRAVTDYFKEARRGH